MPDYYDRFIRDQKHLSTVQRYIRNNPVKAGLCATPEDWPWGSARREWSTKAWPCGDRERGSPCHTRWRAEAKGRHAGRRPAHPG